MFKAFEVGEAVKIAPLDGKGDRISGKIYMAIPALTVFQPNFYPDHEFRPHKGSPPYRDIQSYLVEVPNSDGGKPILYWPENSQIEEA